MTDQEALRAEINGLRDLMKQSNEARDKEIASMKSTFEGRFDKGESNTRWAFLTIAALVIQAAFSLLSRGSVP